MTLELGPTLKLPDDIATESVAILAKKGAGKSNTAVVMAEEMHAAGIPWVAVDPKGDWWGLRADGDGGVGLSVPILGGLHGDLPLEPDAGGFVADLIVDSNLTCILDVSDFPSKAAQVRFLTAFAERLFRRHAAERPVRHLFLEEADEYLPQRVSANMAPCVGIWSKLVRQGRQRGIGVTLVTQRSAVVNKDALTQTEVLIAMRTTSPQDRKAVGAWVDYHDVGAEVMATLPTLESGEAWVCSPHVLGMVERHTFRRRHTFDSGSTPELGRRRQPVARMEDLDLEALRAAMAESVERAEASDPKALSRKLRDAEQRVADLEARTSGVEVVEVEAVSPEMVSALEAIEVRLADARTGIETLITDAAVVFADFKRVLQTGDGPTVTPITTPPPRLQATPHLPAAPSKPGRLPKAQAAVLSVLATSYPTGLSSDNIAVLSGYSRKSSSFKNSLSALRTSGLITHGFPASITAEGLAAIGDDYERMPTGATALVEWWADKLGKAPGAVLVALHDHGPLTPDSLAEATGYSATSSSFKNAVSRVRALGLAEGSGGQPIHLTEVFG